MYWVASLVVVYFLMVGVEEGLVFKVLGPEGEDPLPGWGKILAFR